jgi:hypothetical protein
LVSAAHLMALQQAKDVRSLYRGFIRVASAWQPEPSRQGRSLKEAILARTRLHFRQQSGAAPEDVETLLTHGRMELISLQRLQRNEFKTKVSRNLLLAGSVSLRAFCKILMRS